jgi:hypothetical protein
MVMNVRFTHDSNQEDTMTINQIKAETALDFLGLVPALLGFNPQQSLVLITFEGNRSCGAIRLNLPPHAEEADFAATAIGLACRVRTATGIAAVAYTDDTSTNTHALAAALTARAAAAGLDVMDTLYVASDGWGSHSTDDAPQPIEQITTPAGLRPIEANQGSGASLPDADPARLAAVTAAFLDLPEHDDIAAHLVELFDRVLDDDPENIAPADAAQMILALTVPATRDVALVQWTTTALVGEAALAAQIAWQRDDEKFPEAIAGILQGQTPHQPQHARLSAALDLVRHLTPLTPASERPGPLSAAAWLAWALGRSTHAAIYADRALAVDPEHVLAQIVATFTSVGHLAEFMFARPER